ncbi:cyclodeaminase/cyclohydrolase family protein [Ruania rhizosphaerae]|uniref:cyclodeaminase/cyclohydrolase family protein n=1 Tax=Ruania rhizosphaerae TaxID=1840413 RepID=UPI001357FAFD|nr:cyclodeaminase/cyclohydrolase family protein [Ruania rhizosphaerae]
MTAFDQQWLGDLGAARPDPGGGAATAAALALAAALTGMVARYAPDCDESRAIAARAEAVQEEATELIDADARASARFAEAFRLPENTRVERRHRDAAIERAVEVAHARVSECRAAARRLLPDLDRLEVIGNAAVRADVGVAAELTGAVIRASEITAAATLAAGGGDRNDTDASS